MFDFICIGSAELFGPGRKRKVQNENVKSPAGFETTPDTQRRAPDRLAATA